MIIGENHFGGTVAGKYVGFGSTASQHLSMIAHLHTIVSMTDMEIAVDQDDTRSLFKRRCKRNGVGLD